MAPSRLEVVEWLATSPWLGEAERLGRQYFPRRRWPNIRDGHCSRTGLHKLRSFKREKEWEPFLESVERWAAEGTIDYAGVGATIEGVAFVNASLRTYTDYPYCAIEFQVLLFQEHLDHAGAFTAALVNSFDDALSRFDAVAAGASWQPDPNAELDRGAQEFARGTRPVVWGYRMIEFIPAALIQRLGGVERVVAQAPVVETRVIQRDGALLGVLANLVNEPAEIDTVRLRAWREFLRPVFTLPMEGDLSRSGGGLSRPYDVLPEDWWPDNPPANWPNG